VLEWYKAQEESEKFPLHEVKVLIVGDGGAGKTSLVKQLFGEQFDKHEFQTHGINIRSWNAVRGNTYTKVNLWDFGGQEIMHATHQFFLSKRSLYILVLDGRKDEKTEYWLKHIESFGGNSPILVVLNKIDEHPSFEVNRRFLQEKYSAIQGFYRVSCANGTGIQEFSNGLVNALANVELLRTTWAKSWFTVKTQLENLTEHFISYDRYQTICKEVNITGHAAQETLVEFLNDLGVILHFKDLALLDTHVLNPQWATEAVYRIINAEQLAACKGILRLDLLETILQPKTAADYKYPRDKYRYIIELMKKFELCYEIDQQTVLIPDLLDVQEPRFEFDDANALKFRLEYDFLPRSVLLRFIVRRHQEIKDDLRWRTGVVLADQDLRATAIVKADYEAKTILMWVNGERKREYFAIIRNTLRQIHQSFEKLDVTELVPLPDHPEITVEYQELIGHERMREPYIVIGKLGKKYRVKDLLDGIERSEDRELQDVRDQKLHRLKMAHILETDEAEKFRLEYLVNDLEHK
jgi:internalin A